MPKLAKGTNLKPKLVNKFQKLTHHCVQNKSSVNVFATRIYLEDTIEKANNLN